MSALSERDYLADEICELFTKLTGDAYAEDMTRNNIEQWRGNISGRKKMWQIAEAFKDCLGPETRKYICAPCSNCKGQIREMLEHNDLYTKNNFAYGGLVELIVNAMVNVNPGFIKFEGEEE